MDDDKARLSKRVGEKVSQVGVWATDRIFAPTVNTPESTVALQICTESVQTARNTNRSDCDRDPSTPPSSPATPAWMTVISVFLVSHKSINFGGKGVGLNYKLNRADVQIKSLIVTLVSHLLIWYLLHRSPIYCLDIQIGHTGCFFLHWYPPKKLKYGKPRLGESTLT